jgi:hypothetical protein
VTAATPDDLYTVAPADFTAARNALVKELRAGGHRDAATEVAARRRPRPTVWALNQVARQDTALVTALLATGTDLRAAMQAAVDGDPSGLRDAEQAQREAEGAVLDAAERHLAAIDAKADVDVRRRMADTLRAAVLDEIVGAAFEAGRLDDDADAPGLGFALGARPEIDRPRPRATPARPATPAAPRAPARTAPARPGREARERAEAERRRKAELAADARRLRKRAERLRAEATRLDVAAADARADAEAAEADAADAERRADDA